LTLCYSDFKSIISVFISIFYLIYPVKSRDGMISIIYSGTGAIYI